MPMPSAHDAASVTLPRSLRELPACSCENRASGVLQFASARVHECRKRDEGDAAAVI